MSEAAPELVKLTKRYGDALAVDAIDLKLPANACCRLLGPSGCGKTSTLRGRAGAPTPGRAWRDAYLVSEDQGKFT